MRMNRAVIYQQYYLVVKYSILDQAGQSRTPRCFYNSSFLSPTPLVCSFFLFLSLALR